MEWIEVKDPTRRAKFWQDNYYEPIIRNTQELPPSENIEDHLDDLKEFMPQA